MAMNVGKELADLKQMTVPALRRTGDQLVPGAMRSGSKKT